MDVQAVFDDIKKTRNVDKINNFWTALAAHPPTLERVWNQTKDVMAPGSLDAMTKEMLYLAVSATNQCSYCMASHTASARKQGMTNEMLGELMAVVGLANQNNALAMGYRVEIDEQFKTG
jgi:AhpD family alkylhydroperoxidase